MSRHWLGLLAGCWSLASAAYLRRESGLQDPEASPDAIPVPGRYWPLLTTAAPLPPQSWRSPAEDSGWMRLQRKLHAPPVDRTRAYEQGLASTFEDDSPDSVAWRQNAMVSTPPASGARGIWWAICNSSFNRGLIKSTAANSSSGGNGTGVANGANATADTNGTDQNATADLHLHSGSNSSDADDFLDTWAVMNRTFCPSPDQLEGTYNNESAAALACGKDCSGVLDVGCRGTEYRLCRFGAETKRSMLGSCLWLRLRRPPEKIEFWREFCTRHAVPFRVLFPNRKCAVGHVLAGAFTEMACAEATATNSNCSNIFDLKMATPPPAATPAECRCVLRHELCSPGTDVDRDVFTLI